jgi:DNA recombination protein RmuC
LILKDKQMRYDRQIILPEVGEEGQKKLQEASGHIDAAARRSRVINKRLDGRKDEEDTLEWQEEVLHERE